MNDAAKNFDILTTSLSVLHNYFDSLKLFSDLYLAKFLDIIAKYRSFRVHFRIYSNTLIVNAESQFHILRGIFKISCRVNVPTHSLRIGRLDNQSAEA